MIHLYGIKNCDSVRKVRKILQNSELEFLFHDFREVAVDESVITSWISAGATLEKLLNKRGTTYRNLKLKELTLDNDETIKWLARENMLIKRPVLVTPEGDILIGVLECSTYLIPNQGE